MTGTTEPSPSHPANAPPFAGLKQRLRWSEHRRRYGWVFVILVILICLFIYSRSGSSAKPKPPLPTPVALAAAQQKNVPVYIPALGTVTADESVTIRTQINGQLLRVLFTEGQMVRKGTPLAQIDPRPYQAQLAQYEGELMRDKALLDNARIDLKRYEVLWKQNAIAQQTLATQQSLVKQYEGAVALDQGLIQSARLNLVYCYITSPINGRIGLQQVDEGNYVQTSDVNGLALITSLNPITVIFSIPEDTIFQVMSQLRAGKSLTAVAYDRTQNKLLGKGVLLAVDSAIDTATGTVNLKAQFNNEKNTLFPNQFVNIKLRVDTLRQAIVIPTAGVQHRTEGTFVYLTENRQSVSLQPVTTGITDGENTVITHGLLPGQVVVVEGADKLIPGAAIMVPDSPAKAAATAQVNPLATP